MSMARSTTHEWLQEANLLRARRSWQEAQAAIESAWTCATSATEFALLGEFLIRADEPARAFDAYDRAVALRDDDRRYRFNRAALGRFLGKLELAEEDYDRVIEADPRDPEAWLNRSELRLQTPDRNHVPALLQRLGAGFDLPVGEVPIRYALAKELEDLAQYQQSWTHLIAGAAIRRRHMQYDVKHDLATVNWIIDAFGDSSQETGCPSREPIFIVGLPRSGTSLLERFLGGSKAVFAAGEMHHFAAALVSAVRDKLGRPAADRRELVYSSATLDFARLGADYLERTRPRTGAVPHFTDKMPLNYLYCGLICRALPGARILHQTRHPIDTCYAMFKTLFQQGYPFSYDLGEIADYYLGYRRLMEHWHCVHPGIIADVNYERLVQQPQHTARRVYDFCALPWQDDVLETHARSAPTLTASAAQVRRPVYTTSVGLWRRYEQGLAPLVRRLGAAGITLD